MSALQGYADLTFSTHSPDPTRFTGNTALSRGAHVLDAILLGEAWQEAVTRMERNEGFDDRWTPILATLGPNERGGGLRVQFVNIDDPSQARWAQIDGPEFRPFKEYLDGHLDALNKAFQYEGGSFTPKGEVPEGDATDGLNAMFVVQKLIEHFNGSGDKPASGISNSRLATALKLHSYLTLTQLGQQTLADISKISGLVKTLIISEEAAQSSLSTISRALGRVSEGLGVVLSGVNVGFDAYELSQADTELQKAVYGTQLAFDSATFLAAAGSFGAGFLGASSVAAVLGGAGVILTGLGIGAAALVEAFEQVAGEAKAVGKYFWDANYAYTNGGYEYDAEEKTLKPLVNAVIQEINVGGHVQFDSQYIYRTHHGSTGSGRENYFFWAGDFPKMVVDKSQAINVRTGIGAPATGTLPNTDDFAILILPYTPKSYISYFWMNLPFATGRHDTGFDLIRKLEVDERFDYDFYIFPSDFSLAGGSGTRWILDPKYLADTSVIVKGNIISVGGVEVSVADPHSATVLIAGKDSQVLQVDCENHSAEPVDEDASKYPGGSQNLLDHLTDLNAKHQLHGSFVAVENYTSPAGEAVGRAYYDVSKKRMLFTLGAPASLTKNAQLVGYTRYNDVYFCNPELSAIWRVDATSGVCLAKYDGLYPSSNRELLRVWQEDDYVHAVFRHQLPGGSAGELSYILRDDSMRLASIVGDPNTLYALGKRNKWTDPLAQLLQAYVDETGSSFLHEASLAGREIKGAIDSTQGMISVFGQLPSTSPRRYWIRLSDRVIIRAPLGSPPDIVLAGTIRAPSGDEEYCFYSLSAQVIMLEEGAGVNTGEPRVITVPSTHGKLRNLLCVSNVLFSVTERGYILRLTQQGTFFLEAVDEQWLTKAISDTSTPWWTALKTLAESLGANMVTVLGLHDTQIPKDPVVPAWLCDGKLVIASRDLYGKQLFPNGSNHLSNVVPAATKLLDGHPFKSVVLSDNGLQYTTTEGLVLIVTATEVTLYGVDDTWQMVHSMTMEGDLGRLANQWEHGEVITLLGYQPAWYVVSAGKLLTVDNVFTGQDRPRWLALQNVRYAMVTQSWLSTIGRGDRDQTFACVITGACWTSYRETVVQFRGDVTIDLDASDSELGDLSDLLAKKIGDDLSIFDVRNGRTLTLRKVFVNDGDSSRLQPKIMLGRLNLTFSVADIRNALGLRYTVLNF
ncbi:hypothetical protein PHLGIDRAFT_11725 [Phlebiopsis gigantea 11061_1 CR5-6]|uniref:TcdA/TcdB toxin pore forming domain-containing protein n=1 Tax=Phlebiopsis gigantea (strain 11061_1 CR5-6) TaxID=745531 RepID=A0A0C3S2V4_PHLG1|nr:hypothetical protein PHLGIDRAFT_11725 [Phlebiopsis gigantea 11061_1 CR5-6]